jgi:hypothetical protein
VSPLKEFADFITLNMASLVAIYSELLAESNPGHENFSVKSQATSARRLLKAVIAACESQTFSPLFNLFNGHPNKDLRRWPQHIDPPPPLAEIECLEQTLMPVVPNLIASEFLWQMLSEVRAKILHSTEERKSISAPAFQPEITQDKKSGELGELKEKAERFRIPFVKDFVKFFRQRLKQKGDETESEHVHAGSTHPTIPAVEPQPWEMYALIGGIILQSTLVIKGNVPGASPWLLALLAIGLGQALLWPATISRLGGLAVLVLWVLFRQATGIWIKAELDQSLAELVGLGLIIALTIRYRQIWLQQQLELQELRELRQLLYGGEVGMGLLPLDVAELRLLEEVDRASQFRRPLGLLLAEIEPLPEKADLAGSEWDIYRAIGRQLTSAALVHDIPFRLNNRCFGLILPERDWPKLYDDADAVANALKNASFLDQEDRPQSVLKYIKLNFGLGTYQGEGEGTIDLMRAVQDSLNISRELADLSDAEESLSAYAMPATPIVEPKLVLWKEEQA